MSNESGIAWKRLIVEGAAIVISILLAFWIDAWWAEQQTINQERAILAPLVVEIKELEQSIFDNRIFVGAMRDSMRQLLVASVSAEDELSDGEIDRLLADIHWYVSSNVISIPTLDSLITSGDMDTISNAELRRQLGRCLINLDGLKIEIKRDGEFYDSIYIPYILKHTSMVQYFNLESRRPGFPDVTYPYDVIPLKSQISHRDMLMDREFQNLLLQRITTLTNILEWPESQIEKNLKEIVELIEHELAN